MEGRPASLYGEPLAGIPQLAIAAGLAAAGTLLALTAEFGSNDYEATVVGLLVLALGFLGSILASAYPAISKWLLIAGTQAIVLLAAVWLRNPMVVGLLALPPTLAAVAGSTAAAGALGMLESVVLFPLLGLVGLGQNPFNLCLGLAAIWCTPVLVWGARRRVVQQEAWLGRYYETTYRMVQQARDHEAELNRVREDGKNALRQLSLANERLGTLRAVAEKARKSKAAFVASVSHEFRTPLNIIIGMVNLMIEAPESYDGEFPPHAMEQLRTVYENCQHLTALIDDVLDLSRVEAGRMTLHREAVDLNEVVRASVKAVRPLIDGKGLSLVISSADGLPDVMCDRTRVRQIVLNLLSNAARLTDRGGIEVRVEQRDHHVGLAVSDTGPGIAPEDAEQIFEPFQQGTGATWRDRGGSGLGLSLSRTFAHLHGGRMWFESELGQGTTFYIELPMGEPPDHHSRPDRGIKRDWVWLERSFCTGAADKARGTVGPRVLVCDEQGSLATDLARHTDTVQIVPVDDLSGVAEELRRCPAHAVILNASSADGILPMVQAARERAPDTPIVGCCCPPRSAHAREAGALDYLTKPVLREDLARAMQAAGMPVRRLLIVDDKAAARDLLASYVRAQDDGVEILEASGSTEALSILREKQPDLVLVDIIMPESDGWELLATKAADESIRAIPAIVISAQDARDAQSRTPVLVAAMGQGLSVSKLLACSEQLSRMLLETG